MMAATLQVGDRVAVDSHLQVPVGNRRFRGMTGLVVDIRHDRNGNLLAMVRFEYPPMRHQKRQLETALFFFDDLRRAK